MGRKFGGGVAAQTIEAKPVPGQIKPKEDVRGLRATEQM
jgi:hypothetical protein